MKLIFPVTGDRRAKDQSSIFNLFSKRPCDRWHARH